MAQLLLERIATLFIKLIGMAVILFFISYMLPADPAAVMAGTNARPEQVEAIRQRFGLDQPFLTQFTRYFRGLLQGDLGISLRTRNPVVADLRIFFPATLELALLSAIVTVVFGVGMGLLAAVVAGSWLDLAIRLFVVIGMGLPVFVLGLLLQLIFASNLLFDGQLKLLPLAGRLDTLLAPPPHVTGLYTLDSLLAGDWRSLQSSLRHLVLPVTALTLGRLAVGTRFTRSGVLEALAQPYIRTARSKGLRGRRVVIQHAFRNALIPVVTMLGVQIGFLLSGAVLVEVIFNWPGLGLYAVESVLRFDFFGVIGASLVIALVFVTANTVVDILISQLDPRIRYR